MHDQAIPHHYYRHCPSTVRARGGEIEGIGPIQYACVSILISGVLHTSICIRWVRVSHATCLLGACCPGVSMAVRLKLAFPVRYHRSGESSEMQPMSALSAKRVQCSRASPAPSEPDLVGRRGRFISRRAEERSHIFCFGALRLTPPAHGHSHRQQRCRNETLDVANHDF